MISENPYWYSVTAVGALSKVLAKDIAGKWVCYGSKQELHLYLDLLNTLVEDGIFRAAKIAKKDPASDPFPHKECVLLVFTSNDESEIETIRRKLIDIGLRPKDWKSEYETREDWQKSGKLRLESEIVEKKKKLSIARTMRPEIEGTNPFDVFLCHNRKEKPIVRELGRLLRSRGLRVWLDEWELVPGRPWQEGIERAIEKTASAAVLIGPDGVGPWQDREMRGFLSEFVRRSVPVIPVLLPGVTCKPDLPVFLREFTWVDLSAGFSAEVLDKLQWGITGVYPNSPAIE